jgi:hypothetical protein
MATQYDKTPVVYTSTAAWVVTMTRTLMDTKGEDFDGNFSAYSIAPVCFYTGSSAFSRQDFKGEFKLCLYYQIYELKSYLAGYFVNELKLASGKMQVYGYMGGHPRTAYMLFYQNMTIGTLSTAPAFILKMGENQFGTSDFVAFSQVKDETGDYFGES